MGLGKTIQAIASMSAFKGDWPLLIIAPSVAKFNWKNELLRWLKLNRNSKKDNNTVLVLNENKIKMLTKEDEDVKGLLKGKPDEVVITSFKIAMKNKTLKAGMFKAVIVDESHRLKKDDNKTTKKISALLRGANRVILLSGTPALSDPCDLETQLKLVAVTKDEKNDASNTLTECHFGKKTGYVEKLLLSLELGLRVQTYIIRRLKGSTSCVLPPLRREIEYVDEDEGIKSKSQSVLRNSDGKLAKICKKILQRGNGKEAEMVRELLGSDDVEAESKREFMSLRKEFMSLLRAIGMAKARRVVPVIEKFIEENEGKKLIIFAHHVEVLDFLEGQCESYFILTKSV